MLQEEYGAAQDEEQGEEDEQQAELEPEQQAELEPEQRLLSGRESEELKGLLAEDSLEEPASDEQQHSQRKERHGLLHPPQQQQHQQDRQQTWQGAGHGPGQGVTRGQGRGQGRGSNRGSRGRGTGLVGAGSHVPVPYPGVHHMGGSPFTGNGTGAYNPAMFMQGKSDGQLSVCMSHASCALLQHLLSARPNCAEAAMQCRLPCRNLATE